MSRHNPHRARRAERRAAERRQLKAGGEFFCAYCAAAEGKPHADGCPKTGIYSPAVRHG